MAQFIRCKNYEKHIIEQPRKVSESNSFQLFIEDYLAYVSGWRQEGMFWLCPGCYES